MVPQPQMSTPVPTSTSYATQPTCIPPQGYNPYYPYLCLLGMTTIPHMGVNFFQPSIQQQTQQFEQFNITNPSNPQNKGKKKGKNKQPQQQGKGGNQVPGHKLN